MIRYFIILGLALCFSTELALAQTQAGQYLIEYATSSPIQSISLKKATLQILILYYGNPKGYSTVVTDENQKFTFNFPGDETGVSLAVLAIKGEEKYSASCEGRPLPDHLQQLIITCKQRS